MLFASIVTRHNEVACFVSHFFCRLQQAGGREDHGK
jgi:hypothetical protein